MLDFRLKSYKRFLRKPTPSWGGAGILDDIDYDDIYYYIKPTEGQAKDWDMVPSPSRRRTRSWASPRPSASTSPASPPSTSPRSCTTATVRTSRSSACCSATWTPRCASIPRSSGVLRDDHPAQRQQVRGPQLGRVVRWVVHLRAAWRPRRPAAAGLLPHQRREHGPVRADADHRRRGRLLPLRRGLLGARLPSDSLHSAVVEIVVKEGGRCRYTTIQNWSNNVYNLVTKRAAAYRNATMEWIDGNLGLQAHHEVPGRVADGRGRPR